MALVDPCADNCFWQFFWFTFLKNFLMIRLTILWWIFWWFYWIILFGTLWTWQRFLWRVLCLSFWMSFLHNFWCSQFLFPFFGCFGIWNFGHFSKWFLHSKLLDWICFDLVDTDVKNLKVISKKYKWNKNPSATS